MAWHSSTGGQIMWLLRPLLVLIILQYKFILSPVPFYIYVGNSLSWLSWQGRIFGEWFGFLLFFTIDPESALLCSVPTCCLKPAPAQGLSLWYHSAWHSQVVISCPSKEQTLMKCQDVTMRGQNTYLLWIFSEDWTNIYSINTYS